MRMLWLVVALVLAWGSILPAAAQAAVVGRLTEVQGRVELLKGGKLPATPVQLGAQLESGDVLRSKSLSKAQITLIDNSVITLSPQSRLAIDEFTFDAAQGKRQAVIEIFSGLAHVLVNKLFTVQEPDFVVKTHTAVTGVRGTDFGIRLQANSTTILNFSGVTQVANIFPEVGGLDRKIHHVAFSFGPPGSHNSVILNNMQGTSVAWGLPPTLPFTITGEDRTMFMNQLGGPALNRQKGQDPGTASGSGPISQSNFSGPDAGFGSPLASTNSTLTATALVTPAGVSTGAGDLQVTLLNTVTVPPTVPASASPSGGSTPAPAPGPTPSTFTFTQQYYAAFITGSNAPYTQSGLLAYAWGYRTGVYDGYFYSTTQGSRTMAQGLAAASVTTGTSTGFAEGTVTGILGQKLTGTMTVTGTDSFGNAIARTGKVTILPNGALAYNWTDTVTNDGVTRATGTGTTTQTPGTYFSQTVTGQATGSANMAGNQLTATNYGDLTGSRVENGITTSIRAGYSVTSTAPNAGTFTSSQPGSVTIPAEGVLGAPDANGVRTGVMTYSAPGGPVQAGGPVREVPANGASPAATFATIVGDTSNSPTNATLGVWAQTSDPNAQIVTQTYQGSTVVTPPGATTGTLTSTGWGYRSEPGGSGSILTPTTGGMTGTVTQTGGGTFSSNPDPFNYTMAAVINGSPNRTGPAQGVGFASSEGTALVSTTGTATINQAGVLTHTVNGTWISPDSQGTLNGVTLTQTPGTYFQQTTNTGTGAANLSPPTSVTPYTQTATLSAEMTRTGVAPATLQVLNGTITSTTSNPANFPAPGQVPTVVDIQGVTAPGGTVQSGNMTMTTHQGPGTAVSSFTSPVAINTSTNVLTASNLVGRNVAHPGVNRAPATQTGTATSTPAP
jgi:hypothetical protein